MECHQVFTLCERPNGVHIEDFSNATHIGGAENVEANLRNFNELVLFINKQNGALNCYEIQAEGKTK